MLRGIVTLLACQVLGEVLVRLTGVQFPGPVIGMLLFFVVLQRRRPAETSSLVVAPAALLRHLQLLFIPAGVGIVVYLDRIREDALPLSAGLLGSWVIGFVATALVVSGFLKLQRARR